MDGAILPINFYCRNARLCLKKAALSKKSNLHADELQHLKAFETLVVSTIPGHPLYPERKDEKPLVDLRLHLQDARKRIKELEESRATTNRLTSGTDPKGLSEAIDNSGGGTDPKNDAGAKREGIQSALQGSKFKSRENTPSKAQKIGGEGTAARFLHPRNNNGAGNTQPKTTRSADSTPRKKQRSDSPRKTSPKPATEFGRPSAVADSQKGTRKLHQGPRSDSSPKAEQQQDGNKTNPKMHDTYAFASKHNPPRSKSTPILQRLRNVSECLGSDTPRRGGKDKSGPIKVSSLSRENSPFITKSQRELPRLKALGLVSSAAASRASLKATIHLSPTFDNCDTPGGTQLRSEDDDPEYFNTHSSEERQLSPNAAQIPSPPREEDERKQPMRSHGSKNSHQKGGPRRPSPGRFPAQIHPPERRDRKESLEDSQSGDKGGRSRETEVEDEAESIRRDEAAWTTFRLQEQFGEALKELGSLQDRDDGPEGVLDECLLRASSHQLHKGPSPHQSRHGGRATEKTHLWTLGAHAKGDRLREIDDEEGYCHRRGGGYLGNGESEQSGKTSPVKPTSRKKSGKNGNGEGNVHYGQHADHLELFTAPHSGEGSDRDISGGGGGGGGGHGGGGHRDRVEEDCQRFREKMRALKRTRVREQQPTPPRFRDQQTPDVRSKKRRPKEGVAGAAEEREREVKEDEQRAGNWRSRHWDRRGGGGKPKDNVKPISPMSTSSASSSSSSTSSSSSLSSLPLSHYIHKLKCMAPESKFSASPARTLRPCPPINTYTTTKLQRQSPSTFPRGSPPVKHHHHHHEPDSSKTLESPESGGLSDARHRGPSAAAAILLPKSPPTSHATLSAKIQQRLGHLSKEKKNGADKRLDAVLGGCALVQSHLQRTEDSPEGRKDGKERTAYHKDGGHPHKSPKFLISRGSDLVSFVSQKRGEAKQADVLEGSIAGIQRLVGELKGFVEGFKIRIEVESEGWRGRVEGLEKEIETLKDETDDELMELKKSIKNEVNVRMNELAADVERIRRDEKDQVETLVQARLESHLSGSNNAMGDLKKEIRGLWAEVENLTKEREEMQSHVERVSQMSQESKDGINKELRSLKRDLQGSDDRSEWRRDNEMERTERAEMRHALEKIKDEGLDMKMEVNGLKKAEKVAKTEVESVRKLAEKMQEDAEEMEKDRAAAQMEGVRERLLIMERVESLSQLYLGGLEEVRTDVYNVKFSCRDRMDELESQWGEFKRQQESASEDGLQKQRLANEMELFRAEIGDMMEIERVFLRETLEREHDCIRRQMMDLSVSNKNDLTCMMKVEVQKRVQAAKDKVMSVADPIKKDMDRLRMDLEEAQQGAEAVANALAIVEKERDHAAQGAADAAAAAKQAGEVLTDLLGPVSQEMAATRRKTLALQDAICLDRDVASQAFGEAKQMKLDFQEFIEQEKIRLKTAVSLVQKERDTATTAASEASSSAMKAGEVLAEVLGSFNQEMSKARRKSFQLQEGLDRERESLERDREDVIQRSQESQEKFNKELERAITTWKRAMNQEVAKAKGIIEELEDDRQRVSLGMEHPSGHPTVDRAHIAKTQEVLTNLQTAVDQIQETPEVNQEEKKRRRQLKQEAKLRFEQDQRVELTALRVRIDECASREETLRESVNESGKRIKKLELLHMDLAQSFQEVRTSTGDLEKTAAIWLPKYENAARIVNDITCKVETLEERCNLRSGDEGPMDSKVKSLKDMATAETELKDLFQRVETADQAQRQVLSLLEARVNQLENFVEPEVRGLSLKLEYLEKTKEGGGDISHQMIGLTQTLDTLERKLEVLSAKGQHDDAQEQTSELTSKLNGLESRIELVASATFTNLRLLDSKVEECTSSVQQALEGAATAENKCSALGTELVKVFRMLASSRQANPPLAAPRTRSPPSCGRDHSPTKTDQPAPSPPRTRSPPNRRLQAQNSSGPSPPRTRSPLNRRVQAQNSSVPKRGPPGAQRPSPGDFARSTMASEMRKVTPRGEEEEYTVTDVSPSRERASGKDHNPQALVKHQEEPADKGHHEFMSDRAVGSVQEGEIKRLGRFKISQDQPDEKQKEGPNKCQRTNIRLEAGRIHVNVSHRSGVSAGNCDKRAELVAVQT